MIMRSSIFLVISTLQMDSQEEMLPVDLELVNLVIINNSLIEDIKKETFKDEYATQMKVILEKSDNKSLEKVYQVKATFCSLKIESMYQDPQTPHSTEML